MTYNVLIGTLSLYTATTPAGKHIPFKQSVEECGELDFIYADLRRLAN